MRGISLRIPRGKKEGRDKSLWTGMDIVNYYGTLKFKTFFKNVKYGTQSKIRTKYELYGTGKNAKCKLLYVKVCHYESFL